MSNKIINLKEDNECSNKEKEENILLSKNLIYKYELVDKLINFFMENFKKDESDKNNSDNLCNLFCKYDALFYDNICSTKKKLNLNEIINILNNETIVNKNIINDINNNKKEIQDINGFTYLILLYDKYCEIIKELGNSIIDYSDNILKEINNLEKNFDKYKAKIIEESNQINIKNESIVKIEEKDDIKIFHEKNDLSKNINNNKELVKKDDIKQENDAKLTIKNINLNMDRLNNIEKNGNCNNEETELISKIENSFLNNEKLNCEKNNINIDDTLSEEKREKKFEEKKIKDNNNYDLENIKENKIEKEEKEIEEKIDINTEILNNGLQKEEKNQIDIDTINKNEEYIGKKEEESTYHNDEIKNILEDQKEVKNDIIRKKDESFEEYLMIKKEDDNNYNLIKEKKYSNEEIQNIKNKIIKLENKNINIKYILENLVEEIINSFIKIIVAEPNFFIKNIIVPIEEKIINKLITQILQEKEKEKNNIEINNENAGKKENEIKVEENPKDILNDEINNNNNNNNNNNILEIKKESDKIKENNEIKNQNIKNDEINKENEDDSFSENNIKNIDNMDSLLGNIYEEEEENFKINKELNNLEVFEEKEKNDKSQEKKEDKLDIEINNKDNNLNFDKRDSFLDKEMKELDELLNLNEIKNEKKIKKEIIDDKKILEEERNNENKEDIIDKKINNDENINEKMDEKTNFEKNTIILNSNEENIKNKINSQEKEEISESLEKKVVENHNVKDEYDFELEDEEDIDKIIKNEDNKELKSNICERNNNNQEKNEIHNEIKKEDKNKNKEINIIIKNEEQKEIIQNEQKLSLPLFANLKAKEIFIESAIKKILGKNSILKDETKTLIEIIFKKEDSLSHFFPYFLSFLKKRINKKIRFLPNYENFKTLIFIFENNIIKEKKADIFDLIIELSQYIKYENNYLYQYLRRKIDYFKQTNFWKALIENLLINSLNNKVKFIINRENKKNDIKGKAEQKEKKSFWKEFFSNPFIDEYNLKEEEHNEIKRNDDNFLSVLELMSYTKYIKGYHKLNSELKKELEDFSKKSLEKILYKYIKNMSNYGFNFNEMKILTLNFSAQFGFNNDLKENFINLIDCYKYKNYNQNRVNLHLINEKNIINDDSLICIISNIFIYLPTKERIKLFILNKKLNSKNILKKEIFNKILRQKNLALNKRLIIWEDIINISKLKKEYNYTEIKDSTLKKISSKELKKDTRLFNNNETINKDVNRTVFLENKIENQNKLKNILCCLNLLITSIGYYQGISYIAAFLLQILDFDEEKTFYYMLALETQTDYKNLFINNLELLNNNFRIFEKILEIGLPDIYLHLNKYKVLSDYFTPSWFLTIFACVSPIFDKKNIPKFCILVFEKFILDGWNSVFIAGFTSLKLLSKEFLKTNEFNIYNYITTDFSKKDIFKNAIFSAVENEFVKNSEFIDNNLILLVNKICNYEKKYNSEE